MWGSKSTFYIFKSKTGNTYQPMIPTETKQTVKEQPAESKDRYRFVRLVRFHHHHPPHRAPEGEQEDHSTRLGLPELVSVAACWDYLRHRQPLPIPSSGTGHP
jgi:hypothetical protein